MTKKIGNSIFRFEQQAGIDSPLGNWRERNLEIHYIPGELYDDDKYYYISLWIVWSGLSTKKATISLYKYNDGSSNTRILAKSINLTPRVVFKVPKQLINNIDTSYKYSDLKFFVEIKSFTLTAKTDIFNLKANKEIKKAYFAKQKDGNIKTGKYKKYTFKHKQSFSGSEANIKKQKNKIAKDIYNNIKKELIKNKQETTVEAIVDALTKNHYQKGDSIQIPLSKKQKIYEEIKEASIGNDVFIVVKTEGLFGKKVKLKIHEKEKTIILKNSQEVLPVLVYDSINDTKTTKEQNSWITVDIKKDNGEEIGIKKIQLRPKQDKILNKDEAASKSMEGWEEALYLREDETKEGKKAIEEAKRISLKRKNENFVTLTKDDSITEAVSFPKKTTGPCSVEIGKDAVYTLTQYNYHKTTNREKDKNNIQWSLWVQGNDKDKYTVIDSKSKPKLYTYAKCELIDGKNKLTIVFDKALKNKTVQIEPFRNSPDIDNKKAYVIPTTINEVSKPKIVKTQTAKLWLQTRCDDCEADYKEKTFLKEKEFALVVTKAIHIYHDGKISKVDLTNIKKISYIYHDKNGNTHNLGTFDLIEAQKWNYGSKKFHKGWKKVTIKKTIRYYEYANGKVKLLKFKLPLSYNSKNVNIKLNDNSTREYINPEAYACLIGALAEVGYDDITLNGFTSKDGTGAPSVTHFNGIAGDFRYLRKDKKILALHIDTNPDELDIERQEKFIDALVKFGWKSFYSFKITINKKAFILKASTHLANHHHHIHLRRKDFKPNYK